MSFKAARASSGAPTGERVERASAVLWWALSCVLLLVPGEAFGTLASDIRELWLPVLLLASSVALWRRAPLLRAVLAIACCALLGMLLEAMAIEAGDFRHRAVSGRWYAVEGWAAYQAATMALSISVCPSAPVRRTLCAVAASLSLGLASDPVGLAEGVWAYPGGGGYVADVVAFDGSRGIPWWNFLSWAGIPLVATPLLGKAPAPRLGIATPWLALYAFFIAKLVALGLWQALAASLLVASICVVLARR